MRYLRNFLILIFLILIGLNCSGQGSTVVGNPPPTSVSNPKKLTFSPIKDGTSIAQIPLDFFGRAGRDVEISSIQVVINGLLADLYDDLSEFVQTGRSIVRLEINNLENNDLVAIIIIQNGAPRSNFEATLSEEGFSEAEVKSSIDIVGSIDSVEPGNPINDGPDGFSDVADVNVPIIDLFPGLSTELEKEVRADLSGEILFFSEMSIINSTNFFATYSPFYHDIILESNILYTPVPDNKCRVDYLNFSFGEFFEFRYSPLEDISVPETVITGNYSVRGLQDDIYLTSINRPDENFLFNGVESFSLFLDDANFSLRLLDDNFIEFIENGGGEIEFDLNEQINRNLRQAVAQAPNDPDFFGNAINIGEGDAAQYFVNEFINGLAGEVDLLNQEVARISYENISFENFENFSPAEITDHPFLIENIRDLRWNSNLGPAHNVQMVSVRLYNNDLNYIVCHLDSDDGNLLQVSNLDMLEAYYQQFGNGSALDLIEVVYHHSPSLRDFTYLENGVRKTKKVAFLQKTIATSSLEEDPIFNEDVNNQNPVDIIEVPE